VEHQKDRDAIEFTQELADSSSGYAYVYRKTVRLVKGKPEMVLEHSLKNAGSHAIRTSVYNHNFLVLDKLPPGPGFVITVPFRIQTRRLPTKSLRDSRKRDRLSEDAGESRCCGISTGRVQ